MGKLVKGEWIRDDLITSNESGEFTRPDSVFRDCIGKDHPRYQPERDRYHLYVSYACPWAHRTLIMRGLKKLEDIIAVSVVHPDMLDMGWTFDTNFNGTTGDRLHQKHYLHQLYQLADSQVSGRATVPILWDKKTNTIVNNESSDIIRILNSAFNDVTGDTSDYCPEDLRGDIDRINEEIYNNVNNGVYRCGFARSQQAYDVAVEGLFATLDKLEQRLKERRYLFGERLTEADIRLIPTLLRFDLVYYFHFKVNLRKIADYPSLYRYTRELYEMPSVKQTTFFDHIKRHYYYSQKVINPFQIIPVGPVAPL